jgi:hypothetical protein
VYGLVAEYQASMLALMRRGQWGDGDFVNGSDFTRDQARVNASAIGDILRRGTPYFCAREACDLIEAGGREIPPLQLRPHYLPTDAGFVWFERPLSLPTGENLPRIDMTSLGWWGLGEDTQGRGGAFFFVGMQQQPGRGSTPATSFTWVWDQDQHWVLREGFPSIGAIAPVLIERVRTELNLVAAFVAFMDQRIVVPTEERLQRPERRRLERMGVPRETVSVMRIRRPTTYPQHGGERDAVDWSCRWIVSGHWRQQACGPRRRLRRPLWVTPYVKGPQDKPLKPEARRVFAVAR